MRNVLLGIGVLVVSAVASAPPAHGKSKMQTRYIPGFCYVFNNSIAITTLNMDTIGQGAENVEKREFDFDSNGITFNRPPIATAAEYSRIARIQYLVETENERGLLSVVETYQDGNKTEELGYVQTACWDALMAFFKRKNIKVNIEVERVKSPSTGG